MGPFEASILLFSVFLVLVAIRVPVSVALGLATLPVFILHDRLTISLLFTEMFKAYNSFLLLSVPFFLLAANLMNAAGITDRMIRLCRALVGWMPGGLGHVNVSVSMLFAGISGSSTADAAGIGSLMIPAMEKEGYDTSVSVAITSCSSVMGVIIPPSVLMIIWGGVMSVSIGSLFLAGVVPGILIGGSMMVAVYLYALKRGYPRYAFPSLRELSAAFASSFFALTTPVVIVGGIVAGFFTPTEASVVAVLYSMMLGLFVYRSLTFRELPKVFYESARFAAIALFAVGTASAFSFLLAYFQVPKSLVVLFADLQFGPLATALIVVACFLIIGMFIDAIPAIIILGTVLWPVAETSGMHPIHFAILGVVSLAFGLVTPPYGLCLMIACSIGKIRVIDALRDTLIILAPMVFILLLIAVLPDLILWLPRLLTPKFM